MARIAAAQVTPHIRISVFQKTGNVRGRLNRTPAGDKSSMTSATRSGR